MARYADIDKVMQNLKTDKYGYTNVVEVGIALDKAKADVVPKSEVERLQAQNENLDILVKDLRYRNKEYIALNRRWAKECADLQEECDQIKDKVAREIFEGIEKLTYRLLNDNHYIVGDMIWDIAELKKKYTESENNK